MSTVLALLTMLVLALINHFTDDRRIHGKGKGRTRGGYKLHRVT